MKNIYKIRVCLLFVRVQVLILRMVFFLDIEQVSTLSASITLTLMTTVFLSICVCHWATDFTKWWTPPGCVLAWMVQHWLYTLQLLWPPNYYDPPIIMTPTIIVTHKIWFRLIMDINILWSFCERRWAERSVAPSWELPSAVTYGNTRQLISRLVLVLGT